MRIYRGLFLDLEPSFSPHPVVNGSTYMRLGHSLLFIYFFFDSRLRIECDFEVLSNMSFALNRQTFIERPLIPSELQSN